MKIAIIGYGKMGKEIEQVALDRGHEILLKLDVSNIRNVKKEDLQDIDVAVEFSNPESAFSNINLCFDHNIPIVSGTTGWLDKFNETVQRCKREQKTFFYASNYSIGVNLFFKLNSYLAKMMNKFSAYDVHVEETHHTQKLDAPSGTAITLTEELLNSLDRKKNWEKEAASNSDSIAVMSFREGKVPGNHKVTYESSFDKLMIEHNAKSRKGFALGAVLAAEFIVGKTGYFSMNDMLKI
ncbi:MAG: 4-hydroxy-tetrahydrodipicolinate reductase [Bacteroidetes bacterium]|nr:4-hydroxy-tetrahydrodipicolinate reductase [Bacteroidota bacterium]